MSLRRLLLYKLKIFLANFSRGERRKRYVRLATLVLVGLVFVGFCFATYGIFSAIRHVGEDGFLIAGSLVSLAFHALLILAFVFDVAATTNIFFLSSDLGLLMAAPLPALRVFALKYLEAMGAGSLITCFIAFPVVFGFALAFGAPWIFYLLAILVVVVFLSIPVSIGTLAGLLISRVAPATRVKEILGLAGGVLALGLWLGMQLLKPYFAQEMQAAGMGARLKTVASYGDQMVVSLLPSQMAARSLTRVAGGDFSGGLAPLLRLIMVAGALVVITVVVAERLYVTGWFRVTPASRRPRRSRRVSPLRRVLSWLPPVERSVVTTTAWLLVRDPQQIMPVATITIMMGLFPFLMARSRPQAIFSPGVLLQSFAVLSFIGSMNLAVNATVIDGRNFWVLLASPYPAIRKLFAKLLVSAAFFIPLAAAAALAFRIGGIISWSMVLKATWFASCMTCVGGSLGLLLGVSYGDWEWELPKRMLRTSGRLLMLGVMGAFFAATAIFIGLASGLGLPLLSRAPWPALLGAGALAALVTYAVLRVSAARMEAMEWKL